MYLVTVSQVGDTYQYNQPDGKYRSAARYQPEMPIGGYL